MFNRLQKIEGLDKSGKQYKKPMILDTGPTDTHQTEILTLTKGYYIPWQTLDLVRLISRLPDIHEGLVSG